MGEGWGAGVKFVTAAGAIFADTGFSKSLFRKKKTETVIVSVYGERAFRGRSGAERVYCTRRNDVSVESRAPAGRAATYVHKSQGTRVRRDKKKKNE